MKRQVDVPLGVNVVLKEVWASSVYVYLFNRFKHGGLGVQVIIVG